MIYNILYMNYNLSIPDIYNIEKNHSEINKNIFSKTIILESDKIYDLDEIFVNLDKEHFTGIYIKTYSTNIYLSTNKFKDVNIYNNFFILELFNRCDNYYNFIAKEYDADLTIYVIIKPTTNMSTYKYISHNKSYFSDILYSECLDMNRITLQINIICKNDKLNNILKFELNKNIFYFKSRNIKKINNKQYLYIFYLHKIENIENNDFLCIENIENILNINNIDNVITYINKLNEINRIICYFLFEKNKYGTYYMNFSNYIIKNNIDKLYYFVLNFS